MSVKITFVDGKEIFFEKAEIDFENRVVKEFHIAGKVKTVIPFEAVKKIEQN